MRRFFFVLFIFLVACQIEEQLPPETVVVITPEEIVAVENISVPPTQIPTTTPTYTPAPESTVTPTPVPTVEPTPSPTSDPFSTIASGESSMFLKSSIVVTEEVMEDDVKLHRVNGWDDGFRPVGYCQHGAFQWLDESHLLLFPVVDKDDTGFGPYLFTSPIVLDLDTEEIWITPIANSVDCELPAWSDTMQSLIVLGKREFLVLNVEREILNRFPGRGNPFLSPSGSKFFAYNTWYDLQTGQTRAFSDKNPITANSENRYYDGPLGWSDDETRLIRGSAWVDVKSGETQLLTWPKSDGFGHGGAPGLLFDYPIHFINDNLVLFSYPTIQDGELIVPLFELRTNKIANIQGIIGIDPEILCDSIINEESLSFLAIRCGGVWYVIDPETMTMDSRFIPSANAPVFSPDDQYAVVFSPESQYFLWENGSSEFYELDISPLATLYDSSYMPSPPVGRWSPDSNWFLFWTEEFEVLSFLNPTTKELISISFPYANGRKMQEFWTPSEDQVALLDVDGRDGSLWWVSDLSDDRDAELVNPPEVKFMGGFWQQDEQSLLLYDENGRFWKFSFADAQLEPMTTIPFETIHIHSVKFSPDGTKAAFTIGTDKEERYSIEGSEVIVISLEGEE